jgi:hypothetical protein
VPAMSCCPCCKHTMGSALSASDMPALRTSAGLPPMRCVLSVRFLNSERLASSSLIRSRAASLSLLSLRPSAPAAAFTEPLTVFVPSYNSSLSLRQCQNLHGLRAPPAS